MFLSKVRKIDKTWIRKTITSTTKEVCFYNIMLRVFDYGNENESSLFTVHTSHLQTLTFFYRYRRRSLENATLWFDATALQTAKDEDSAYCLARELLQFQILETVIGTTLNTTKSACILESVKRRAGQWLYPPPSSVSPWPQTAS